MRRKIAIRSRVAGTDWDAIHRRLEQVRQTMEDFDAGDSDARERILRDRAASLAKTVLRPHAPDTGDDIDVLVFQAAGEKYAVEACYVAQACPMPRITSIPGTPDYVVGIVAVEGEVLSVIDLRSLLDLPLSGLAEPASILVLKGETMEFAVLAEAIVGMQRVHVRALQQTLATLGGAEATYLKGLTPERVAVLDANLLLNDSRLVVDMS